MNKENSDNYSNKINFSTLYKYTAAVSLIWVLLITGTVLWVIYNERTYTMKLVENEALSIYKKDLAIRLWATSHGGVYVSPNEITPPSPYLSHIPDRDVQTTSGKNLTLMNPAYILRQTMENYEKLYGIKGHITSLKVLNPNNAPNDWEHKALIELDRGAKEVTEIVEIDGEKYFNLIRPMITKVGCLKCHAHQGYKIGDIRGGVSITIPMKTYLEKQRKKLTDYLLINSAILVIGLFAIGFISYLSIKRIIERKQAERNLQESEKNYRELVENANSIILRWIPDGTITFFNEFAQKFFGFDASEIIGKNVFGTMISGAESTGRDLKQMISDIIKNPANYEQNENENICKDGKRVWVNWTNRAIQDQNGNVIEILSVGTDITKRNQAEAKSKRLSRIVEESLNEIYIFKASDYRFIHVNRGAYKNLGYSREEMSHFTPVDLKPEFTMQHFIELVEPLQRGKTDNVVFDTVHKRKNGSLYPVEVHLQLMEKDTEPIFVAIILDITERKQAERNLRESEERYKTVANFTYDWEIWKAPDDTLIYISPSCERITGYSPKDFFKDQQLLGRIIHPKDHKLVIDHTRKCLGDCDTAHIDFRIITKNGEERWISHTCQSAYGSDGKFIGRRISNRDITDRKHMEESLLNIKKLEATATLAGGLAHDFNNLLGGILNYISLAKEDINPKDEAFTCLSEVEKISIEAGNLTQKFITFSKGGIPGSAETVMNINEYLSDTVDLIVSGSNMECEYSFLENLRPVEIDKSQIRQAILNIIINSKEAMPDGGSLKITSKNVSINKEAGLPIKAGNYVKIIISDNGCGITKVNLPVIFDLYFSTKTKGTQKGTGLGLSTVYSIIKYHEGHISVESKEGVGTDVSIYLPVSQKPLVSQEVKEEPKTREDRAAVGPKRILFMDDEEFIRLPTKKILERMGHEVELACHGVEAIQKYAHARDSGHPFDVVILDLTIKGGMGGKQTIEELLKINPNVKAIVASGYSDDPVISNYKKYGFCASLPKPSSKDKMREALAKLC